MREVPPAALATLALEQLRPISASDFEAAMRRVRPSVSAASLHQYEDWNQAYGSELA